MALTGAFVIFTSILLVIVFAVLLFKKQKYRNRPYFVTIILTGMLFINWGLYWTGMYAMFPGIGGVIFLPIWFVLCGWGFITCLLEFKNNTNAAAALGSLSLLSTLFGLFLQGLSRM